MPCPSQPPPTHIALGRGVSARFHQRAHHIRPPVQRSRPQRRASALPTNVLVKLMVKPWCLGPEPCWILPPRYQSCQLRQILPFNPPQKHLVHEVLSKIDTKHIYKKTFWEFERVQYTLTATGCSTADIPVKPTSSC